VVNEFGRLNSKIFVVASANLLIQRRHSVTFSMSSSSVMP
jgi:hypothetical protein